MYTNESLVKRIKDGEANLISVLWENNAAFIEMRAAQFSRYLKDAAISTEDLIQSGYFALLQAINYFDNSSGFAFLTYLSKTLLKQFYKTAGFTRQARHIVSLNESISTENDDISILDTVEDMKSQEPFNAVIVAEWQASAYFTILESLQLLSFSEQVFIWNHYFESKTQTTAAKIAGYSSSRQFASSLHARIMWKLRHCSKTQALYNLLCDIDYYENISSMIYRTSAENTAIKCIEHKERRTHNAKG